MECECTNPSTILLVLPIHLLFGQPTTVWSASVLTSSVYFITIVSCLLFTVDLSTQFSFLVFFEAISSIVVPPSFFLSELPTLRPLHCSMHVYL